MEKLFFYSLIRLPYPPETSDSILLTLGHNGPFYRNNNAVYNTAYRSDKGAFLALGGEVSPALFQRYAAVKIIATDFRRLGAAVAPDGLKAAEGLPWDKFLNSEPLVKRIHTRKGTRILVLLDQEISGVYTPSEFISLSIQHPELSECNTELPTEGWETIDMAAYTKLPAYKTIKTKVPGTSLDLKL